MLVIHATVVGANEKEKTTETNIVADDSHDCGASRGQHSGCTYPRSKGQNLIGRLSDWVKVVSACCLPLELDELYCTLSLLCVKSLTRRFRACVLIALSAYQ